MNSRIDKNPLKEVFFSVPMKSGNREPVLLLEFSIQEFL
jgi:hypothetical protein